jgi:colanic acid/amylovoran biosynthesis glycosyltransferase
VIDDAVMTAGARIAIFVTSFPSTSETFVADHVSGMLTRGWHVDVVCMIKNTKLLDKFGARDRVSVHELGVAASPVEDAGSLGALATSGISLKNLCCSAQLRAASYAHARLARTLARIRPDVVHAHFGGNALIAAVAGARRLVVDFHGHDVTVVPQREGWGPYQTYLSGAMGVVHSSFTEKLVSSHLSIPLERVVLGVDHSVFQPFEPGETWPNPLRALSVGRLVFQKGHHVAIAALAHLQRGADALPVELTIVGDGPDRNSLARYAECLGVDQMVKFAGAATHQQVAEAMRATNVLIVPSTRVASGAEEAFGRVAIEGLGCGLPVIVTNTGGLPEAVDGCGMTVPPDNPTALADAMRFVVRTTQPKDWLGRTTQRARQFGQEKLVDGYDSVARKALAR